MCVGERGSGVAPRGKVLYLLPQNPSASISEWMDEICALGLGPRTRV